MAVFPKFKITNKGLDLLNRSIAEKKALTFTKFKIGNGVPSGNWEELNDIVSKFKEFPVLETSVQPNKIVRVKGYFDNKGLTQDYLLKEIGVYAMLEGVAGEILYSYTNAGDTADTIPDENNGFFSRTFDVANYISNATQITFQVLENRFDFNFNTIEEMKNATFLKAGDRLHLWGKTQLGDTTTKTLIVTDTYNGNNDKYTLKNNKIAVVINDIDNKLDMNNKYWLGTTGVEKEKKYIQDDRAKEKDKGYFDKVTGKLYRCIKEAPASITTPSAEYFTLADNITNNKTIIETLYTAPTNVQPQNGRIILEKSIENYDCIIIYSNTNEQNQINDEMAIIPLAIDIKTFKEISLNSDGFMIQGENRSQFQNHYVAVNYVSSSVIYVKYVGNSIYKIVGIKY